MTDRVLLRAGSGGVPPLVMRPYELACTPDDQQLWLADRTGTPHKFVPAGVIGTVVSVAGRTGAVVLTHNDISDWGAITAAFLSAVPVQSVAGRGGDIVLTHADITDWAASLAAAGLGTVTSVGLSVPGLLYTVTGSPVSGAGTLTLALNTQVKNTFLAGPTSGADATPTMRALTAADLPAIANNDVLANVSGSSAAPGATTVTALLDAVLGTTRGSIIYRGATAWGVLTPGASTTVLTSGGTGADLSWAAAAGGAQLPVYAPASVSSGAGTAISLIAGASTATTQFGGSLTLKGGADTGTGSTGGDVIIAAGAGSSGGGNISLTSGTSLTSTNTGNITLKTADSSGGATGGLTLQSGAVSGSAGSPGAVAITAGNAIIAGGAAISLTAGSNSTASGVAWNGPGGPINLTTGNAGYQNANGGDLKINLGAKTGTGRQGLIIVTSLPTADPHVVGALWASSGVVNVSAG